MDFVVEKLMVRAADLYGTMVVRLWQPAKSRGTVFCIHGFEGNAGDFDYLAQHLVAQGYTVVCPDMIGRGQSTYFGDFKAYTFDLYVACIAALAKYAGDINHFIGTSWGGAITIFFLAATRVKANKLLLNDVVLRNNNASLGYTDFMLEDSKKVFGTEAEAQAYVRKSREYLGTFDQSLWPAYLANKIRLSEGKYRLAYDPALMDEAHVVKEKEYNLYPALERIDSTMLLIYGRESKAYDKEGIDRLMTVRRNVSCVRIAEAGHPCSLMTYEQALVVAGFLAG